MKLRFSYPNHQQVAFPLGGIGAGSICLNGQGGLQDFSIRHRPHLTAEPEGLQNISAGFETTYTAFATLRAGGENQKVKVLEGPLPGEKAWCFGLKGQGYRMGSYEGLPRMSETEFSASFPFAAVEMRDPELPAQVSLLAYSPFIPGDDRASGMPCAILEYSILNTSGTTRCYDLSYHLSHLPRPSDDQTPPRAVNRILGGRGICFETDPAQSSASVTVVGHSPVIKARWFRGGWFDAISMLWNEISSEGIQPNDGTAPARRTGRNGGSISVSFTLRPGETTTIPIVICWYFPWVDWESGTETERNNCCVDSAPPKGWKPWYATLWNDASEVDQEIHRRFDELRRRTHAFRESLEATSLPEPVAEAVSANLAILRSPTILRQENGSLWGWEGCFADRGCCPGSCTHVWNYAQALPHLFPQLERTLREEEYRHAMDERGHVTFRFAIPSGPVSHSYHAAADGQLGGIIKLYRDWRISGDTKWMLSLYPQARKALIYAISQWDPDQEGWLREPHHNTYDIEFWGPDGMCTLFYHFALQAMTVMAAEGGDEGLADECMKLSNRSRQRLQTDLFNGEYLYQKTTWKKLQDRSFEESIAVLRADSPEEAELLESEGPKYQYGNGCLSDAVMAAWLANQAGLNDADLEPIVTSTLESIFRHNYRSSLWHHANCQRPGYALPSEGGLLVCSWPKGNRPSLPFPYSDEVWTGIEYHVAAHLIRHGQNDAGERIVRTARARYDGKVRNPFCEYECGNYYARALSSFSLIHAYSGFRYDAVKAEMTVSPVERAGTSFFSTSFGYGNLQWSEDGLRITLREGDLSALRILLHLGNKTLAWERHSLHTGEEVFLSSTQAILC